MSDSFTQCRAVQATLSFATRLMETDLPSELKLWLMHGEYDTRSAWLREWTSDHSENGTQIAATKAEIEAVLEKPLSLPTGDEITELESTVRLIDPSLGAAHLLPVWIDVRQSLKALENLGLDALVEALARKGLPIENLADAFEYLFFDSLVRILFNEHPELWRLSGTTHEETYGRDSQGSLFQRFSGVNSQSGHRRLNVMVTREETDSGVLVARSQRDQRDAIDTLGSEGFERISGLRKERHHFPAGDLARCRTS